MTARELAIFKKYGADGLAREAERQAAAKSASRARTAPRRKAGAEKKRIERKSAAERRREIREACVARAEGRCEAYYADPDGEVIRCGRGPDEMDHAFGRGRVESVETCWMLCHECHGAKTNNRPSRKAWLGSFSIHASEHGYGEARHRAERAAAIVEAKHPARASSVRRAEGAER